MKTVDMSGMGGSYEWTMQMMLRNGLEWLALGKLMGEFQSYENVTGLAIANDEQAKEFEKHLMNGIEDATGAMHHCVLEHLYYINKNSFTSWLAMFDEKRKFEFDGSIDSCPKTELSEKYGKKYD